MLALVNTLFPGAGAKVWGYANALWVGFIFAALILPIFAYRHYVRDGGKFPAGAMEDLALAGGLAIVLVANWIFELPA